MSGPVAATRPDWQGRSAAWLTPPRLRAQAVLLGICLWSVCAVDYVKPGLFDRAGNLKFQDFIQFPIAAQLIAQGRASELYDERVLADAIRSIVGQKTTIRLLRLKSGSRSLCSRISLASITCGRRAGISAHMRD